MSKADYRKIFCETCMSQSQCGYYRDNDGEYCPMLKFYDMGYHQAEKDNKLTWEDVADILDIIDVIANDDSMEGRLKTMSEEEYCQEVLKRFKSMKDEQDR